MSAAFITPQRSVTGHTTRFLRRADKLESETAGNTQETGILSCFNPQFLLQGERRTVQAEFSLGAPWLALSAQFTLWSAGVAAGGYAAVSASLTPDSSQRIWIVTATIDLTSGAAHPLASGLYEGEFLVTTSAGEIVAAHGRISISDPKSDPEVDEFETGGDVG